MLPQAPPPPQKPGKGPCASIAGVDYMFADTLGSIRAVTDSSGNVSCTADYYPYGQEVGTGCGSWPYGFAGYEQLDNGSGNLYAFARFYSPRLGRFLSPDPAGLAAANPANPQTWNGYSYVVNDPANLIDPLGLDCHETTNYFDNGSGIPVPVTTVVCNGSGPVGEILTGVSNGGGCDAFLASGSGDCPPEVLPFMGPGGLMGAGGTGSAQTQSQPQTPSWWGTFAKSLLSNFVSPKFYGEELAAGGCLDAFLQGANRADVLGPALSGGSNSVEVGLKGTAVNVAVAYSASQGLIVPLRSSVVRGILRFGESTAALFSVGYFDVQAGAGVFNEVGAVRAGTCR